MLLQIEKLLHLIPNSCMSALYPPLACIPLHPLSIFLPLPHLGSSNRMCGIVCRLDRPIQLRSLHHRYHALWVPAAQKHYASILSLSASLPLPGRSSLHLSACKAPAPSLNFSSNALSCTYPSLCPCCHLNPIAPIMTLSHRLTIFSHVHRVTRL